MVYRLYLENEAAIEEAKKRFLEVIREKGGGEPYIEIFDEFESLVDADRLKRVIEMLGPDSVRKLTLKVALREPKLFRLDGFYSLEDDSASAICETSRKKNLQRILFTTKNPESLKELYRRILSRQLKRTVVTYIESPPANPILERIKTFFAKFCPNN
jgi:hypothetical protein